MSDQKKQINDCIARCEQSALACWARGDTIVTADPWLVYISLTNACNNKCSFCAHPLVMRSDKGLMAFSLFQKIVDELPAGVTKVYLMKQGEPFLHKDLGKMAEHLKKQRPDISVALHTNAIAPTPERLAETLPFIDSLGVSIDATERALYKKIHGTDSFDVVLLHLKSISDFVIRQQTHKTHVFVDYIRLPENQHESDDHVFEFFSKQFAGVSSVDIHWQNNFQGVISEANLSVYEKLAHSDFPRCVFPWAALTVLWDGKIDYCFVESREDTFLGSVTQNSLSHIWNGPAYQALRQKMAACDFAGLEKCGMHCRQCSWLWQGKVQSPQNLCGGYSGGQVPVANKNNLGDWLQQDFNEVFCEAAQKFLSGDCAQALAAFEFLNQTTLLAEQKNSTQKMLTLIHAVFEKYKNLRLWQSFLKKDFAGDNTRLSNCYYSNNKKRSLE